LLTYDMPQAGVSVWCGVATAEKVKNPDPYLTAKNWYSAFYTKICYIKRGVLARKHFLQRRTSTIRSATVQRTGYQRLAFVGRPENAQKSPCGSQVARARSWLITKVPDQTPR